MTATYQGRGVQLTDVHFDLDLRQAMRDCVADACERLVPA